MTGMYAAAGILAALRHRDRTGHGQAIDVALVDVMTSWLVNEGVDTLLTGRDPIRRGNQHPSIVPYQVFAVQDGHVIIACGNDSQYEGLCALLGVEHLATDPRFCTNPLRLRHRDELLSLISPIIAGWSKARLLAALEAAGIPGGPINTLTEVFDDPQTVAREMRIEMKHPASSSGIVPLLGNPLKLSATPVTYRLAPPLRGEHTEEVIGEIMVEGV
jgi:crotonobetainyl-CoA:carnitine CoA-transferase CaiB-like acyl-CoA transferase